MINSYYNELNRGTGRTTKQIKEASPNSIYVWENDNLYVPNDIIKSLGRSDIILYRFSDFIREIHQLSSPHKILSIIFDHAALDRLYSKEFDHNHSVNYFLRRQHIKQKEIIIDNNSSLVIGSD